MRTLRARLQRLLFGKRRVVKTVHTDDIAMANDRRQNRCSIMLLSWVIGLLIWLKEAHSMSWPRVAPEDAPAQSAVAVCSSKAGPTCSLLSGSVVVPAMEAQDADHPPSWDGSDLFPLAPSAEAVDDMEREEMAIRAAMKAFASLALDSKSSVSVTQQGSHDAGTASSGASVTVVVDDSATSSGLKNTGRAPSKGDGVPEATGGSIRFASLEEALQRFREERDRLRHLLDAEKRVHQQHGIASKEESPNDSLESAET